MKTIKKLFKNAFVFLVLLGVVVLIFIFSDGIFKYIIHGRSFYNVYLGDKEYKQGNYTEAIEYYNKAIKLYPKHIKARYNLANIYVNFEDYQSAVSEYEKVLEYKPDYLNARINLGIVLAEEMLDFDRAVKEYKKVINTKTRFINIPFIYDNRQQLINAKAVAYYDMGLAYRDESFLHTEDELKYRDLLLKAIDSYDNSLALNPDNYSARYNLGLTKHLLGLYSEAITGYCKALLLSPLEYEAHYNLAVLLREKRMYKYAFEEFKNAGSLIDYTGDTYKAAYIYSMLTEVSQMALTEYGYRPDELFRKLDSDINEEGSVEEGAFKTMHDMEEALIKRIKTESICKDYLDN